MPPYLSVAADIVFVIGMVIVLRVFWENTFTSSTIEVADDHRVISTGPYAIVRHPMFSGFLLSLIAMLVALGSWWGLLAIVAMMPVLIWRTFDEESMLKTSLTGYADYAQTVRYRLLPHLQHVLLLDPHHGEPSSIGIELVPRPRQRLLPGQELLARRLPLFSRNDLGQSHQSASSFRTTGLHERWMRPGRIIVTP